MPNLTDEFDEVLVYNITPTETVRIAYCYVVYGKEFLDGAKQPLDYYDVFSGNGREFYSKLYIRNEFYRNQERLFTTVNSIEEFSDKSPREIVDEIALELSEPSEETANHITLVYERLKEINNVKSQ